MRCPKTLTRHFGGYNVYVGDAPFASNDDPGFLSSRLVNPNPISGTTDTASTTATGASLLQGTRCYFHVRTRRSNAELSTASNEIETSPRPEGNKGFDPAQYLYDYNVFTDTKSAYGWNVATGQGTLYTSSPANANGVEIVMVEDPSSFDDGSLLISPTLADFTNGWTPRHQTIFLDLGAGDAAWETSIAPDPVYLNSARFTFALQLIPGYGRFKAVP